MLLALRVKNFILMDALELRLSPGFNVLTGETGAGKSIVVGALSLVLGGRASAEQVRPGESEAEVEALFDVSEAEGVRTRLEASDIPLRDGELVLRRVVQANGRSRAYMNGRLCTAGELAALAPELCDIASQHESVALTNASTHIHYLDRFAKLANARGALASEVLALEAIVGEMKKAQEDERTRGEREAFITFQLQEIDAVAPRPGEVETLTAERHRLRHTEKLLGLISGASARLDQEEDSVCDVLARLVKDVRTAADIDPSLSGAAERFESAFAELAEVARDLGRYAERIEANPHRLHEVEDRLYRIEGLLRRHGPTIADVITARERLAGELARMQNAQSRLAELTRERDAQLAKAAGLAKKLSAKRKEAADRLARAISTELNELAMGGARVLVDVAPLGGDVRELAVDGARLSRDGIDRVEFLIAPNKGMDPKPLGRIASGGELSRALLALKRVLAEHGPAGLYVFDEVDAGIGGAVADKIGRAIGDVAKYHQVLCITHLAPIAAFAETHFVVSKESAASVTKSELRRVDGKDRTAEVARMLTGAKVTPAALKAAGELLRSARL
ncbi:MAG: DNA repair protein RecN [Polyangiaceae bacterium]|nr:DNA repair protein RecN [Polyangiaceae bacterium]